MVTLLTGLAALLGGLLVLVLILRACPPAWLRARPRGNLADADFLVVFAFALTRDVRGEEAAGASNAALADWLLTANPQRKPTIVQEGVYLALLDRARSQPTLNLKGWVIRLPHDPAVYVDTMGATHQCWTLASARGWSRPAVIAHDLQQQRMAWLFKRLYTPERVIVPALPEIPFEPASTQHWGTRSLPGWILWEVLFARPAMGVFGGAVLILLLTLAGAVAAGLPVYLLYRG